MKQRQAAPKRKFSSKETTGGEPDYQLLFEKSPIPILVLRPDLTIITATDGYLTATMRSREDLRDKHIFEAFPDNPGDDTADGVTRLGKSLQLVLRDKKPHSMPVQKYDIPVAGSKTGAFEVRYWNPQNVPVLDRNGEVLYILHRVDDVTQLVLERRRQASKYSDLEQENRDMAVAILENNREIEKTNLELQQTNDELLAKTEELKRSNQELAHFASTASHDIQAPFRIVGNYLAMIEDKLTKMTLFSEFEPHFERIYKARERISVLLDDLLTFAMVSKEDRFLEIVDTTQVMEEVLLNLEPAIREKEVIVDVQKDLPEVTGEYMQLMQVFQNLVGNAIKYNRRQPKLKVFARRRRSDWLFGISDNGLGIANEFHKKVFDVFQRLNNREEFPGTGLGLAICKRVIEQHGGQIWVDSKAGEGSTFYFTIPCQPS